MKDHSGFFDADDTHDPRTQRIFVVGTVVGAVFVLLLWAAVTVSTDPPNPGSSQRLTSGQGRDGPATMPSLSAASPQDQACRELVADQAAAVRDARRSLAQWRTHVEAMNRLVAGEITLAQASAFWNQTRVGADRRLRAYQRSTAGLPDLDAACGGSSGAGRQPTCLDVAAARARQLRRADVALETWSRHVQHMEMLRSGDLDPTTATRMWRTSWRAGMREIDRYDAAARVARSHAHAC
jgi:hypothetical protein